MQHVSYNQLPLPTLTLFAKNPIHWLSYQWIEKILKRVGVVVWV